MSTSDDNIKTIEDEVQRRLKNVAHLEAADLYTLTLTATKLREHAQETKIRDFDVKAKSVASGLLEQIAPMAAGIVPILASYIEKIARTKAGPRAS